MKLGFAAITTLLLLANISAAQQKSAELKRYSECQFGADFAVAEVHELAREMDRPISPSKTVHLLDGYSIYVAYKQEEAFANVKTEQLRAESYDHDRETLLDGLKDMASGTQNMESTTPTRTETNGFEVFGINRKALDGNVLAVYLLLNPKTHTATTIYLLNDYPETRKFNTIEQFRMIRDSFLKGMLDCFKQ